MAEDSSVLSSGWSMVARNKRYIFWFWLLNLTLGEFGTYAFSRSAHRILDHSLVADHLLHGFSLAVFGELFTRPEFGRVEAMTTPALCFGFVFLLATALFLPGVFQGYASTYRLPREDFFRACGRNLWRFIRIMIAAGIVMGIVAGLLFGLNAALVKKAGDSTYEMLSFDVQMVGLCLIFLVMTTLRIWFDLAEADIVLNDQRAVRKSIGAGFRHTFRSLGSLLGSYVVATILAAIVLVGGIWCWIRFVPSPSVLGGFLMSQLILILLLIPRFWQRGVAVSYWLRYMMIPVVVVETIAPAPVPPPVIIEPVVPGPVILSSSPAPQGS